MHHNSVNFEDMDLKFRNTFISHCSITYIPFFLNKDSLGASLGKIVENLDMS